MEVARSLVAASRETGSRYTLLLAGCVVFVVAVLRNPLLGRSQFVYEEADAYWAMTFTQNPLAFLLDPWIGYLTVVSRGAFLTARFVPFEFAPAFLRLLEAGVMAAVSMFFMSERFAPVIPSFRYRVLFALLLALLPTLAPLGSVLNAQWALALFVVGLAFAPTRRGFDLPLGALAVLSGLPAAMAVGAFWLRKVDRLAITLTVLASLQAFLLFSGQRGRNPIDLDGLIVRLGVPGAMMAVLVVATAWYAHRRSALAFLGLGAAVMVAGAVASPNLELSGTADRYFATIWAGVAFVGVSAASRGKTIGIFAVGVLLVATFTTRFPPIPDTQWTSYASCIGSTSPCVVPIWPAEWTVTWPGDPASYRRYPR